MTLADLAGGKSNDTIDDNANHDGNWRFIQVIEEAVVETIVDKLAASGSLNGKTLAVGLVIPGAFTAIKLTSGCVRAYTPA